MKAYSSFASVYDRLMEETPYEKWDDWLQKVFDQEASTSPAILDVGCGTGTILSKLLKKGYIASGTDLSEEMLAAAKYKLNSEGFHPVLFCQDMRNLNIPESFDVILVLCDSLNYLTKETDVQSAFQSFYRHLNNNGLLIFDVHSLHYIEKVLHGVSFADTAEDVSFIWNAFPTENIGEVEHELTFFIERNDSLYERYDEYHRQRTFSINKYEYLLKTAQFEIKGIHSDFSFDLPQENSDRVFFIAKKVLQ
ncbi:class I SAM-dependent DNA methyltransferase [Alteribacillus bidgolensis]|uniref:Methyltransferase domain-containing protein n=1 Tax=Alteribacillus bidgolensis TaxID=930129 RepID=A0A1G8NXE4_9BACI|nr:class I SAM-dependent methyltransferase [Alteribacillus bidgolensis]SDI84899.1 Methyltransferase domain-containing protein [Alteribacillus bidgolensis]